MTMTDLWNDIIVPLLWLAAGLLSMAAMLGLFKLFNWLMDRLEE